MIKKTEIKQFTEIQLQPLLIELNETTLLWAAIDIQYKTFVFDVHYIPMLTLTFRTGFVLNMLCIMINIDWAAYFSTCPMIYRSWLYL